MIPGEYGYPMNKLIIKVLKIKATCPIYKVGDRIVIDEGYKLNLKETNRICMHSLASIIPYDVALSKGIDPKTLGLAKEGKKAYLQCLDPCELTGGRHGNLCG
ncbi:unnamed protein product [marine sediment metagenome]|uniref:TIGR04076 family protein n=1 Tax=marine sediment metagenome TaxID=412755 RepID=X1U1A7_9ZZZZ